MSNILVTGGSGLLGKNIIPLLEKEHKVIAPFHSEKHYFVMDIKKRNRQCKECDPVDLVLGIGDKWMCFDCKHSPYKQDEWI